MPSVRSRLVSANAPSKSRRSGSAGQRRELVHDRVGPRGDHGGDDRVAVEAVGDDGLDAGGAQRVRLGGRAGRAGDVVARGDQQRDERGADGAGGACEEDAHVSDLLCCDEP